MSEVLIKNDLLKEVETLSATTFESVCYEIFKRKFPDTTILHNGVNADDRPVKGTLDVNNSNLEICLECSVEKKYFIDDNYTKICNDIEHIITLSNGNVSKIYLYCSQIQPPSFIPSWVKSSKFKKYKNYSIEFFDCRRIVDEIYDYCVERGTLFDFIGRYLPNFKKNMDRETYFENVQTQVNNYVNTESIFIKLQKHINEKPITVISGLSGAGKTELAIYYAKNNSENFENVFWLTGDNFDNNPSMNNYKRGDRSINLISIFNEIKSLIIIDNYDKIINENSFKELSNGFLIGSRILITSLNTAENSLYFKMPLMPEEYALNILGDYSDEAKKILPEINLPVILSAIKSTCESGDYTYLDIYSDLKSFLPTVTDDHNKRILTRVLNKFPQIDTLKLLCNILNAKFDTCLLRKFISITQFINLEKSSFLIKQNNNTICTFHSFIITCLKEKDESEKYLDYLSKYLNDKNGLIDEYILRQIHLSFNYIKEIVLSHNEELNWITYALLQKEENESKKDIYRSLYSQSFSEKLSFENVRCLLDVKEAYIYDSSDNTNYKECYEKELINALNLYSDKKILKVIYHHLGKYYRRQGKFGLALEQFNKELEIDNNSYPAYGQIIKCARTEKKLLPQCSSPINKIIDAIKNDDDKLPIRIALAFIADLRSFKDFVTKENAEDFKKVIIKASYDGMYQFYEAFVSFINFYSYGNSELCLDLYNKLSNLKFITIDSINERNYANVIDAFSIIYGLLNPDDKRKEQIKKLICNVIDVLKKSTNSYDIRSVLKAYNKLNMFKDADTLDIDKEIQNDIWILLWKAKAKIELNDIKCLEIINSALEHTIPPNFESTFLQCQAKSYMINGNFSEAKNSLIKAINLCKRKDFRDELKKELESIS